MLEQLLESMLPSLMPRLESELVQRGIAGVTVRGNRIAIEHDPLARSLLSRIG
jgi:hypothetical protein